VLELHHVRDMPAHVPAHDWVFLGVGGVVFIVVGWLMARGERPVPRNYREDLR
jgi:hypothetical protein